MSERRFYFRELAEYEYQSTMIKQQYTITESELKRRLKEIIDADHPIDNCIDILLHGEGKEEPMLSVDEANRRIKHTDPWEEWVEGCPEFVSDNPNIVPAMFLIEWRRDLKAWIKRMPRRK